MKISIKRRRRQSGNVLIEAALGLLVLISVFSGSFQFGFTFYQYNALATAVNNGAHYAGTRSWDSTTGAITASNKLAIQNMVVYGDQSGTLTKPVLTGLTVNNISVTPNNQTGALGVPASFTVSLTSDANGKYYVINSLFGQMTLNGKPSVTYPFQGFVTDGYTIN
jgi:Flp pilus assembly protein TadG